jgi:hypothetical protein
MGLGMRLALVATVAAVVFLLSVGAGARWQYWWAMAGALYVVDLLSG